jgi:hypothetical protein
MDSSSRARLADEHELSVRLRAATLCGEEPERFFRVVRDSDRREREGADPVDALEQALDAAGAPHSGTARGSNDTWRF